MWQDTDLRSVSRVPAARPAPLIWDGADNLFFRPLSETLGVVVGRESVNVNSVDEVPDSAWFTNRIGVRPMSLEEVVLGACTPSLLLDGVGAADGSWVIDKGKGDGSTDGFRVTIPEKGRYLFKADDEDAPEHASAAQTIGSRVLYAAGYFTSCEQVVTFRPSVLKLKPGLRWKHNFGDEVAFDQATLDRVLDHCPKRDGLVRMAASAWLPGSPLGGFRYEGTRADDPNDVVPHEDRRDLRGLRVLDAWLDRFDERRGNTFDAWIADGPGSPDSSPGHVIHNHLDTSEALGSEWNWDPITRRLGYSYVLDWGDIATDFVFFGARTRTWDTVQRRPGKEKFVYFNVDDFVPDQWKNEYPVAPFSRMTESDGAWMARILARFTPDVVDAIVRTARFGDAGDAAYVSDVLEGRLYKILERYLTRLSSVSDLHLEPGERLCGIDLAEARALRDPHAFRYAARHLGGAWLPVERRPGAGVCVALPRVAPDGGAPDDDASRYVRVRIEDGVARGALLAYLYDLGPARGYRLAGLERPEP
jgi:hypothetical protein